MSGVVRSKRILKAVCADDTPGVELRQELAAEGSRADAWTKGLATSGTDGKKKGKKRSRKGKADAEAEEQRKESSPDKRKGRGVGNGGGRSRAGRGSKKARESGDDHVEPPVEAVADESGRNERVHSQQPSGSEETGRRKGTVPSGDEKSTRTPGRRRRGADVDEDFVAGKQKSDEAVDERDQQRRRSTRLQRRST